MLRRYGETCTVSWHTLAETPDVASSRVTDKLIVCTEAEET